MAGYHKKNVFYIGEFDMELEELVVPLTMETSKQADAATGYLDLWITSYGGNADVCQHFIELVEIAKAHGVTVRTIVPSAAFSAGSFLAITGTPGERYVGRNAQHLVHHGQIGGVSATPKQHERFGKYQNAFFKQTIDHYNKYADIPNLKDELDDDGFFIPAAKCLKWNLADKYLDKYTLL